MNEQLLYAMLQLSRFALDVIELMQKGDMTRDEFDAAWDVMAGRISDANELWESAGEN